MNLIRQPSPDDRAAGAWRGRRSWAGADVLRVTALVWFVVAGAYYAKYLLHQTADGLTNGRGKPFGDDFLNYWSGATLAWQGRAHEIYDMHAFHLFEETITGAPLDFYHYSYPPVLLLLTLPLAAIPYVPALGVWLVASWYAFYRSLRLAFGGDALFLALATPALLLNAMSGQNGAWNAALLGGGLGLLNRAPIAAGILFGLLIYKPHLGLLIPVALLAGRQWRAFAAAAATVFILLTASVLLFGVEVWSDYLRNAEILRHRILEDGTGVWHRMVSVFVGARRLGAGVEIAYAIQAATALLAAAVVALAWARGAPEQIRYSLLILGTWLATPYLQDYDLVAGAFVVAWLFTQADRSRRYSAYAVSALILVLPLLASVVGNRTGLALGPFFLIPAFLLVANMAPARLPRAG